MNLGKIIITATSGTASLAATCVLLCPAKTFAFTAINNTPPSGPTSSDAIGQGGTVPQQGIVFQTGSVPGGYFLSSFTPYLGTGSQSNNLTLSLYATTSGLPTGAPLASDSFTLDGGFAFGAFVLDSANAPNVTGLQLDPSTSYALALSRDINNPGDTAGWLNSSNTYAVSGGFTHVSKIRLQNSVWTTIPVSESRTPFRVYKLDVTPVPAPLPIVGAAAAFGYSRKLRKRIKDSKVSCAIG